MPTKLAAYQDFDNPIQSYFRKIRHKPLLDADAERELSMRVLNGDQTARQELVESNLKLVVKIAKAYMLPGLNLLDLIQEGNVGLIQAASKYDYRKNVKFSTYAAWWIKQAVVRFVNVNSRVIPLPHRKEVALRKCKRTASELNQSLHREPNSDEIASAMKVGADHVRKLYNAETSVCSLNASVGTRDGELIDFFGDDTYLPETEVVRESIKAQTRQVLEDLLEMERDILLQRFCFSDSKKRTLRSIAQDYGISPETVRQIEKRALQKLREEHGEMKEFLYN
jgi:RNA polymerase primary sigma factor